MFIRINTFQNIRGDSIKRGVGLIYDEKKVKLNLTITPTAIAILDAKAKTENCSISALVEEFARSLNCKT